MSPALRRLVPAALIAGGLVVWAIGLFADPLGVGGVPGFNWKQVLVAEAGVAAILGGVLWTLRTPRS